MIRILFCGGNSAQAEELCAAFSKMENFFVVPCASADRLPCVLTAHRSDIILLDTPPESAIDSVSLLRRVTPSARIVLWTERASPEVALKAIPLGVRGVVVKTASTAALLRCLTRVSEGELWFDKSVFHHGPLPTALRPGLNAFQRSAH
jgi:DNA-binding NarL/FixJ family response regulator